MSCNESEVGTLKLPSAVFSSFRRELNIFCNERQTSIFNKALQVFDKMTAQVKSKAPLGLEAGLRELLKENKYSPFGGWNSETCDGADEIVRVLLPSPGKKLSRPQKKDFPMGTLARTVISDGEWSISFGPTEHSVRWSVDENNHSCERAHEHTVVKQFFAMLGRVKWVRGSGGEIVGNNEYNREAEYAGGGGNFIIFTFGLQTKLASRVTPSRVPFVLRRSAW